MNQKFSQDFTGLFKRKQDPETKYQKPSPMLKSRVMLAAEALDNCGIGITESTKIQAVELIRRINNYKADNRIQYD